MNHKKNFTQIKNHLKKTGFIFQGSEIYGGLANTWDYGPLGTILMNNIKALWQREFITKEENNVHLDSKILMHPKVWEASGHVNNFSDLLIENKVNGKRYRVESIVQQNDSSLNVEAMSCEEMEKYVQENVHTWEGSKTSWTKVRKFNLMFETHQGVLVDSKSKVYLRPETAQGIFINFKNVQKSMRLKLPLGIGQIGKAFRNEITPGNFTFRTREFEQMELEIFVKPGQDEEMYKYYINKSQIFLKQLGIKEKSIRLKKHSQEELAHYSKETTDVEFEFTFGWGELLGIANRTDFDLKCHMKHSKKSLEYRDPITNQVFIPFVIEPSMGLDRLILAVIIDAYEVEQLENSSRIILKLSKEIAPYQVAILPLNKKKHSKIAKKIYQNLIQQGISATYDDAGSIGRCYRRQDSIGTPIAITVIDQTEKEGQITIRDRDSMKQETINIKNIYKYI